MADGETRNVQLVREFFATLSTGDLEALRALLHPDGSWEVMGLTIVEDSLVMPDPEGFTYARRKNGDVVVNHHGRIATVLRGRKATEFLDDAASGDDQELMARVTGNYKRGNERDATNHPRNHR